MTNDKTRISYGEYIEKIYDPQTTEQWIAEYSIVKSVDGPFDLRLEPDPAKVEIPPALLGNENAMALANDISRSRRKNTFDRRKKSGRYPPVLVSEGDSWFQFPVLVEDIIDGLESDYLIYSLDAAGDKLSNMIYGAPRRGKREFLDGLNYTRNDVRGFLFSGAGNDILGEDASGKSVLLTLIKKFNGNVNDAVGHIDHAALNSQLSFVEGAYQSLINDIRAVKAFQTLPIYVHGYDYVFPYPWKENGKADPRKPKHAKPDQWLGSIFDTKRITDQSLRRDILMDLIDQLYARLGALVAKSGNENVFVVDCRGAMPDVSDWIDEIHGTSAGFSKVSRRFRDVISKQTRPGIIQKPPKKKPNPPK